MSVQTTAQPRWPHAAWDVAILRGLDERARLELEGAGRLRTLDAGAVVFSPGDPADVVVVVVVGEVEVAHVPRGGRTPELQRVASRGELVGEEAILLAHGSRSSSARARSRAVVAELPVAVLTRALGRLGGSDAAERVRRSLERRAARDVLRVSALGAPLSEAELDRVLDALRHVHLARGDVLFREGEPAAEVFVVASGLLQVRRDEGGRPRILGYVARGDLLGEDELDPRAQRRVTVGAPAPAWVLALPREVFVRVARPSADTRHHTRRLRIVDGEGRPAAATAFADVYRLRVARSMLVIDQDACVRCGHCTWSCASTHDDGIARLVRRGEKLAAPAPLLVPNSCQHCRNPACMVDCPTGAIARDDAGDVHIREDLCTGCGACARACPWDNIQLAASAERLVAVKCDLCATRVGGPACVSACPTEAIARIDPSRVLDAGEPLAPRARAWPWVVGAALATVGLRTIASQRVSGVVLGVIVVVLAAAIAARRLPRLALHARVERRTGVRAGRVAHVLHVALGVLAVGVTAAHVGAPVVPRTVAGALTVAFGAAVLTGLFGATVHALVPPRVTRLERVVRLPEDLAAHVRDVDARLFGALTGRSEVVKALYARVVAPYARARLGVVRLALSGRGLKDEERRLLASAEALLRGHKSERLAGLDELVRLAVERRATGAVRLLSALLRGWLVPHVVLSAIAAVLLAVHVAAVVGGGR